MSLSPQGVAHGTVVLRIDPSVRYRPDEEGGHLELLKAAANASLDMIALTDIGTISGFEALQRDLEKLLLLEKAGILSPSDEQRLNTHRDLRTRTQLLPGFTVTSSEGLRLSGIFAPDSTPSSITTILQHLGASSTDGLCHETAPRVCALIEAIGGVVVAHPSTSEHAAIVQTLVQTGVLRYHMMKLKMYVFWVDLMQPHSMILGVRLVKSPSQALHSQHCAMSSNTIIHV
jgi:hypothetical protein